VRFDDRFHSLADFSLQPIDLIFVRHNVYHGEGLKLSVLIIEGDVVGKVVDIAKERDHQLRIVFLELDFFGTALLSITSARACICD
jgi:hypothetical protein